MRILLTNNSLGTRAGTELYVRDLAIELMRRGHHPVAYSTKLGQVAGELNAATVPVISSLASLAEAPDIIHGHHHYETMTAMLWFPQTPAIYYCHGWLPWEEAPLRFPRILRYVAVDELCRERLISEGGIAADRIDLIPNFFDPALFPPRSPLPALPRRALAFSNEFQEDNGLALLRQSCREAGIELDVVGFSGGNSEPQPGLLLAHYDLVFAKARAAIEALAVGTAVILCSPGRLGRMVTSENFAELRCLNFGIRTLASPLRLDLLKAELSHYDAMDAMAVSRLAREQCPLGPAVDRIVGLYEKVIAEARNYPTGPSLESDRAGSSYLERFADRFKSSGQVAERLFEERDARIAQLEYANERWRERCLAADAALETREREMQQECALLRRRCEEAEIAAARAELETARMEEDCSQWRHRWEQADRAVSDLEREAAAVRSSASWRWTQRVLRNPAVNRVFGRWIRAVAERSAPI